LKTTFGYREEIEAKKVIELTKPSFFSTITVEFYKSIAEAKWRYGLIWNENLTATKSYPRVYS
jgi:hypothetical protein